MYQYYLNSDLPGNDIREVSMPDNATHVDCEVLCNTTSTCVAYVREPRGCNSSHNPGILKHSICCLKSSIGRPVFNQSCRNFRIVGEPANVAEDLVLIPYGATELRIAEFPSLPAGYADVV